MEVLEVLAAVQFVFDTILLAWLTPERDEVKNLKATIRDLQCLDPNGQAKWLREELFRTQEKAHRLEKELMELQADVRSLQKEVDAIRNNH